MIGKRKRETAVVSRPSKTEDEEQTPSVADTSSHDLFRKFFEAQFGPLELPGGPINREQESQEDEEDYSDGSESGSDWDVVSEDDEGNQVEVVEYQDRTTKDKEILDKKARKAFMVCFRMGIKITVIILSSTNLPDRKATFIVYGVDNHKACFKKGQERKGGGG
jgi:hypothetical protein